MTQQFGYPSGAVVNEHGILTTPVQNGLPLPDESGWWEYHRCGQKLGYLYVQMSHRDVWTPLAPSSYIINEEGYSVTRPVGYFVGSVIWLRRLSDEEAIERKLKVPDYSFERSLDESALAQQDSSEGIDLSQRPYVFENDEEG